MMSPNQLNPLIRAPDSAIGRRGGRLGEREKRNGEQDIRVFQRASFLSRSQALNQLQSSVQ